MNNRITAIICEYNPFHNGHKYQIEKAKEKSRVVICIMSGNTVQRGGFACSDKYLRAKIAVENGADLVVEHPFPYCMSSAADFASSGVYLAKSLNADTLVFGHESDEKILIEISEILVSKECNDEIYGIIKSSAESKKLSYPKAREIYIEKILGSEKAKALRLPNNILSIEYLINLKKYNDIEPFFIKRNFDFISAGKIREKIFLNECIESDVPDIPSEYFDFKHLDKSVLSMLAFQSGYSDIYDCEFSLYNRIVERAKKAKSIDSLIDECTSSTYTASKIRRSVYNIIFNVKKENVKDLPSFTTLLAASEAGIEYLSENKKMIGIPVITKKSDEKKQGVDTDLAFKPELYHSIISDDIYTPYKIPYIKRK